MPLIKCPMCKREVSSNATACPHCGEPMKKEELLNKPVGYSIVLEGNLTRKIQLIKEVRMITGLGLKEAKDLVDIVPSQVTICATYDEAKTIGELLQRVDKGANIKIVEVRTDNQRYYVSTSKQVNNIAGKNYISNAQPIIKCPNCSSSETSKISMIGRIACALTFDIFTSSRGKTWKCNKCDYKW